ncbi:Tyrosine recombinase XerD [compost metagenome]
MSYGDTQMESDTKLSCKFLSNIAVRTTFHQLCESAGVIDLFDIDLERRFENLPWMAVICDQHGVPFPMASMYLAERALMGRGGTGDSVRTYAESLLCWLRFLLEKNIKIDSATEETLGIYRAKLANGKRMGHKENYSSSTVNIRVSVAAMFHEWLQRTKLLSSPLGRFLQTNKITNTAKYRQRVIKRYPKSMSLEEITAFFKIAREPYKLMFQWGLTTGMRRFEICDLTLEQLPNPESLVYSDSGLVSIKVIRKGGKELPVVVPIYLIERTYWYCISERRQPTADAERYIFINKNGQKISRSALTKEFKRCAKNINSDATLHCLRHTYATQILNIFQKNENLLEKNNAMKVVQVLMGHSRAESTSIYVHAATTSSPAVFEALSFLYGSAQ